MRSVFSVLFLASILFISPTFAQSNDDILDQPEDGDLIAEPVLADYVSGDRSPGILSEPFDIIEEN